MAKTPFRVGVEARRWCRDTRGGIAVIFAYGFPAVALATCGVVDLMALQMTRSKLQDAADAAALSGAKQLGVADPAGVSPRAAEFVDAQIRDAVQDVNYQTNAVASADNSSVTVAITGKRDSFFGNLLPPGGWKLHVQSTAIAVPMLPLCVLGTSEGGKDKINLRDGAQLTAPACLVHANGDLEVAQSGLLQAASAQTSGKAKGNIQPEPQVNAPEITDPFADISLKAESSCVPADIVEETLSPGIHCGDVKLKGGATLTLLPGVHYFQKGKLELGKGTSLVGRNVVMIFDKESDFKFSEDASIDVTGIKTGVYAGFVVMTTPKNTGTFEISTTAAKQLLGTIYIPNAKLLVSGAKTKVNDGAPWTVIVAKSIEMVGSPRLMINANYGGSDVPVPDGVGPTEAMVKLTPTPK